MLVVLFLGFHAPHGLLLSEKSLVCKCLLFCGSLVSVVTSPFKFWVGIGISSLGGFLGWNRDSSNTFLFGLLLLHSVVEAVDSVSKLLPTFCSDEGSPSPRTSGCFNVRRWSCFNQFLGKDAVNPYNTSQSGF